jgi:hypothetical protein
MENPEGREWIQERRGIFENGQIGWHKAMLGSLNVTRT